MNVYNLKTTSTRSKLQEENRLLKEKILELENQLKTENKTQDKPKEKSFFLQDSSFLHLLLETTHDLVTVYDIQAESVVFQNRSSLGHLGYPLDQRNVLELVHQDDLPRFLLRREKYKTANKNDVFPLEYRMKHSSGQWRTFASQSRVLTRDNKNDPKLILYVDSDITEYRKSEEERVLLAQQHIAVVKNLQNYVFKLSRDSKGDIFYVFQEGKLAEVLGHESQKTINKTPTQVYGEKLGSFLKSQYLQAFAGNEVEFEFEFNGRCLFSSIRPIFLNKKVVSVIGSTLDLTQQKQSMSALQESEERYRILVENSSNGIVLTQLNGTIVWSNQISARMLGVEDPQKLIGQSALKYLIETDLYKVTDLLKKVANNGSKKFSVVLNFKHDDRTILPVEVNADILHVGKNTDLVFIILNDVSDRLARIEEKEEYIKKLTEAYDSTLEGWGRILEMRDAETEGHSRRVVELTERFAKKIGLPPKDIKNIRRGATVHDVGKMAMPDQILLKKEDLSFEEWNIMRQHPLFAKKMLEDIPFLNEALDIPIYHHEHWDGSGYPYGLKGEEIPLAARIFSIVDVWDALSFQRHYKMAWPAEKSIDYIKRHSGKLFDPQLVEQFLEMVSSEKLS